MRTLSLPSGNQMPVFGLGTWRMGEHYDRFQQEVDVMRAAFDMGVRLIDTAEMYGEGGAEQLIGEAIRGRHRDDFYLISKFYPHNASYNGVIDACESSVRRMDCDTIDLYLLHWPTNAPLSKTFDALHELQYRGRIRDFGVSNFNLSDLQEIPLADQCLLGCNQVFYNLAHREVEWEVAAWCNDRAVPIMAYSPLDQARSMLHSSILADIAARHSATNAQIALAWLLSQPNTVAIPKSAQPERILENLGALDIQLAAADLALLNASFPAPDEPVRLSMR